MHARSNHVLARCALPRCTAPCNATNWPDWPDWPAGSPLAEQEGDEQDSYDSRVGCAEMARAVAQASTQQ
eukprot:2453558-Pyramimonas_sp.AAC.1